MKPDTPKTTNQDAETTRFRNRTFRADLGRTEAGSPVMRIVPLNPRDPLARPRLMAAFIYELASEMELRSVPLGAKWVVSPEVWNGRLILELGSESEAEAADAFLRTLLAERDLD